MQNARTTEGSAPVIRVMSEDEYTAWSAMTAPAGEGRREVAPEASELPD